jgi:putative membrane protein
MMMGPYGGWFGFGWLTMLLWWGVLILAIIALVRLLGRSQAQSGESALDILKKRYARGEISKEEFESKKRDIL